MGFEKLKYVLGFGQQLVGFLNYVCFLRFRFGQQLVDLIGVLGGFARSVVCFF
jgi:hypothetical protein